MIHPEHIDDEHIRLRPAVLADRRQVFEGLARSDVTDLLLGEPPRTSTPLQSYAEFCDDYKSHYFDDSNPEAGRCFIIEVGGCAIGQINYNEIDRDRSRTELDIWMFGEQHCGQGYGTEAVNVLCDYLQRELGVKGFIMQPSANNPRAVRSYEKAGFRKTALTDEEAICEYGAKDSVYSVYMTRTIE